MMTCYCSLFLPLYFPGSSGLRGSVGTGAYQISKWAQWWIMSFTKLALIFLVNSHNVLSNSHLAMRVEVFTRVCSQMLAMFSINTILFLYYGCESFQVVLTSPVLLKKSLRPVCFGEERESDIHSGKEEARIPRSGSLVCVCSNDASPCALW